MQYLKNYLNKIISRGNEKLAESISKTAEDIGKDYISTFSFTSHEIGLLFGNVQSGKTGQMFGILSKAADLGFPVFLILTTDNVALQQQTIERVNSDLEGFCICGEDDMGKFVENSLIDPCVNFTHIDPLPFLLQRPPDSAFCRESGFYSILLPVLREFRPADHADGINRADLAADTAADTVILISHDADAVDIPVILRSFDHEAAVRTVLDTDGTRHTASSVDSGKEPVLFRYLG